MNIHRFGMRCAIVILVGGLTACAASPQKSRSLYAQFGELPGLAALADDLLERIADDRRIAPLFANTNIPRFRDLFIEYLCIVVEGPCTYTGDDMEEVHTGLGITEADFNVLVEDMIDSMQARKIPRAAQNRLIARLAPMRKEIIYR